MALQIQLKKIGYANVGQPDGMFGPRTADIVREFQKSQGLKVDGIVGPRTWQLLFKAKSRSGCSANKLESVIKELTQPHRYQNSIRWHLTPEGIVIGDKAPETFGGEPKTVRRVWANFGTYIEEWAAGFSVPVELIMATVCTETQGDATAVREEPGFISDEKTPNKVSPGLMQTLISTARSVLGDDSIDRAWLLEPGNAIRAGTAYIARQWKKTHFDPPKSACAYNAGGVYHNDSPKNRWKMRQYPINSSEHADRYVKWFNECFVMFRKDNLSPKKSFFRLLQS